jgi:hypothetical protein
LPLRSPKSQLTARSSARPNYIQFIVGEHEDVFHVQIGLLARYCDRMSMMDDVKLNQPIRLPDIERNVFGIFLRWIHTLNTPGTAVDYFWPFGEFEWKHVAWIDSFLVHLYIFAWDYGIPRFCRALLDVFFVRYIPNNKTMPYAALMLALDHLSNDSPLCLLMLDIHDKRGVVVEFGPGGSMTTTITHTANTRGESVDKPLNVCDYHEHPDKDCTLSCKKRCGLSDIKAESVPATPEKNILRGIMGRPANFSRPNCGRDEKMRTRGYQDFAPTF